MADFRRNAYFGREWCYTGFWCTSELQWDTANHEVWGYSETMDAYYLGRYVGVGAWLTTPSGQYFKEESSTWRWARVEFGGYYGNGSYYLDAVHTLDYWGEIGSSRDEEWGWYYPTPSGETSSFSDWYEGGAALWSQRLTGSFNWNGALVREQDPGQGLDECWFLGSELAPLEHITTPDYYWPVGSGNIWEYDLVGFSDRAVTVYREANRVPCQTNFPQQMQILSDTWVDYGSQNTLGSEIGSSTVSSWRAEGQRTRDY
jgi:hypothetical protein